MIDPKEFYVLMRWLEAAFPRWEPKPETHEVYYEVLGDLDLPLVKAAISEYVASETPWPPSAGQIRAAAFKLIERERGDKSAGEAWAEARKVVRLHWHPSAMQVIDYGDDGPRYEEWGPGLFSEPLVYEALEAVGGPSVFMLPQEVEHTTRARFIQAYETLQERRRGDERMLPAVRELVKQLSAGRERAKELNFAVMRK